jgi:hypothetical protein
VGSLAQKAYPLVPLIQDKEELARRIREVLNAAVQGKLNCTADVRLGHNVVSTTVSDVRCGVASVILPMPTNPNGAAAFNVWNISTRNNGSFVFTHVSTSTSDATATYAIFG